MMLVVVLRSYVRVLFLMVVVLVGSYVLSAIGVVNAAVVGVVMSVSVCDVVNVVNSFVFCL